jgi:predicted N-acetyltransferase YhbS
MNICRLATENDLAAMKAIEDSAFPPGRQASADTLRKRILLYPNGSWVGLHNSQPVAFATSYPIQKAEKIEDLDRPDDELFTLEGNIYFFRSIAVHQEFQKLGLAKMLTEARIAVAKQRGCVKIVFTGTEDLSVYYGKMGFQRVGDFQKFHGVPQAIWERVV